MFVWACERDLLAANPISGVSDLVKKIPRDRVLDMDELCAVWRACDVLRYPFGPLYRLLLLTGCRRGEWAGAKWSWVDVGASEFHIPSEAHKSGRGLIVPLSPVALAILDSMLLNKYLRLNLRSQ